MELTTKGTEKKIMLILKTKDLAEGDPVNKGVMGVDPVNKRVTALDGVAVFQKSAKSRKQRT